MVGAAPSVICRGASLWASLALLFATCPPAVAGASGALVATGACRDGQPNGGYELRAAAGQVRVSGAFARGRRTGTFLFWTANGARLALVPYDDDARTGTVTMWFEPPDGRGEPQRKRETRFVADTQHGPSRSWYPNGNPRTELRYESGQLAEARAWIESGAPLPEADAREIAARDRASDAAALAELEKLVADHRPPCATNGR